MPTSNEISIKGLLAIDFDGTLVSCNSFHRELRELRLQKRIMELALDILKTGSFTKARIKERVGTLSTQLIYQNCLNQTLLELIEVEKSKGTNIVIATGASSSTMRNFMNQHSLDVPVITSTTTLNLTGQNKAFALKSMSHHSGFTYIGDSVADIPIFRIASQGYLVKESAKVIRKVRKANPAIEILPVAISSCDHR